MTLTLKKSNNKKNKKTKKQRGGALKPFGQQSPQSAPPKKWGPFSWNPFKRKPAQPSPVQQATLQRKSSVSSQGQSLKRQGTLPAQPPPTEQRKLSVSSPIQKEQPNLKRTKSMIAAFKKYGTITPFGVYGHKHPKGPEYEKQLASIDNIRTAIRQTGNYSEERGEMYARIGSSVLLSKNLSESVKDYPKEIR